MSYTFDVADHQQIVGRVLPTPDHHIAVASMNRGDGIGYVLAVRPDGNQYVVWTWFAVEDNRISLAWDYYFDAANYRDGHSGAFAAASAYFAEISA